MHETAGSGHRSTIHVDPPGRSDRSPETETRPDLRRNRWRYYFPWVKTAVSAPAYDSAMLIVNRTDRSWLLWHNYHSLGMIGANEDRRVRLVKAGAISARPRLANPEDEYLILALQPNVRGAEIVELVPESDVFVLRALEPEGLTFGSLPGSTHVRELGLAPATCAALRRVGVKTVGQLLASDLGELWEVRDGPAAYAEVVSLLFQRDPGE